MVKQKDIQQAIESIVAEHGRVTPDLVIQYARDPENPLHNKFNWNVEEAAMSHWREVARHIITSVTVTYKSGTKTTVTAVAYVRDPDVKSSEQGYIPVTDVQSVRGGKTAADVRETRKRPHEMLALQPYQIEEYLKQKNLKIRNRGQKIEIEICPFCSGGSNGDRWKCVVFPEGNYKCMRGTCDQSGSFWQLAEFLGDDPKSFYTAPVKERKPVTFHKEPVEPHVLTNQAVAYLRKRCFTLDTMEESAIWCDEQGHICFGYYHKGELCMVKVRRAGAPKQGEQKAWQKWKGGLRTLWGLEQCDKKLSYLCICFGEYDRMALRQSRVVNAVSVPCGDKDLEWIDTCFDELESYDEIILWPDNDKSGQEVVSRIADRLGKSRVRVVKVDYKDPNEMLGILSKDDLESAEDAIYNAVATAEWYYSGDLKQLSEVHKTQQDFSGYLSGIGELDKVLGGFFFGHLTVHGGSHKSGKTMALIQTGCMAAEQGGKVCVWPGEDSADDFKYKTAVHLAGYGGTEMRTALSTGTEYAVVVDEYVNKIDCFLHDKIIFLDKRAGLTEQDLIENFTLAFRRYGCDTFIVDNLMKLVNAKDSANTNSRQAQIVDALCNFAKEYKVHVHLVVHTNKSGEFLEPPTINSISGTKDIANLADRVILWWRIPEAVKMDYGNNETLIIVAADRVFGAEAKFPVIYDRRVKRYGQTMDELMRDYSL